MRASFVTIMVVGCVFVERNRCLEGIPRRKMGSRLNGEPVTRAPASARQGLIRFGRHAVLAPSSCTCTYMTARKGL
jgi:hypothetical protein